MAKRTARHHPLPEFALLLAGLGLALLLAVIALGEVWALPADARGHAFRIFQWAWTGAGTLTAALLAAMYLRRRGSHRRMARTTRPASSRGRPSRTLGALLTALAPLAYLLIRGQEPQIRIAAIAALSGVLLPMMVTALWVYLRRYANRHRHASASPV